MKKQVLKKNKSGFSIVETLCALMIMTVLTGMITLGMDFSNEEFRSSVRNSEARTLASSINSLINEELSYATSIQIYTLPDNKDLGLNGDTEKVFLYSSKNQGDYTFIACTYPDADPEDLKECNLGAGRIYLYTAKLKSDGSFVFDTKVKDGERNIIINAMVSAKSYSEGCFIDNFKITGIADGKQINVNDIGVALSDIINVDYFNVSYDICYTSKGVQHTILSETFQVKSLQKISTGEASTGSYTVYFDRNGGNDGNDMAPQTIMYGVFENLNPNTYGKPGSKFVSWNTQDDGEGRAFSNGASVKNLSRVSGGAVTLYAIWDELPASTYKVNFHINYGSKTDVKVQTDFAYGKEKNLALNDFVRDGYTFVGWSSTPSGDAEYSNGQAVSTLTDVNDGAYDLYAVWQIKSNTITFVTDGGSSVASITQDYGTKIIAPANPKKTGYTFVKWDKTIPSTMPAESMTITAIWKINLYKLTFETGGGTTISPVNVTYGAVITKPNNPTKTGYAFDGWDQTIPATMPANDVTITAKWSTNKYTLKYMDGNTVLKEEQVSYGAKITAPTPSKTGYSLSWDKNITTMPAQNTTINAVWTINQYTITFKDGSTTLSTIKQDYNTAIIAPANPSKTGYTFAGWDPTIPTTMPAKDTVINAKWSINSYTVTFMNGSTVSKSVTGTYGSAVTAPSLSKTGYSLSWDKNITTIPGGNVVINAVWTPISYTVKFNANGGEGSMPDQAFSYDTAQNLAANTFTRNGYTFLYWAKTSGGSKAYDDKESVNNLTSTNGGTITLYAVWQKNGYNIEFYPNYSSYDASKNGTMNVQRIAFDATVNLNENKYTRTGYKFVGWAKSAESGVAFKDKQSVKNLTSVNNNTLTLFAVWEPIQYKVVFNGNGGTSATTTQTLTYDDEDPLHKNFNVRIGYKFLGWSHDPNATSPEYGDQARVMNLSSKDGDTVTLYSVWKKK